MTENTKTPTAAEIYVDPYPGRKGSERVWEDCGNCAGTGIYQGPSGLKIYTATVGGVDKGCFRCNGTGRISFLVSSARASARRGAKIQAENMAAEVAWKARREELLAAQFALRVALAGLAEYPQRAVPESLSHAAYLAAEDHVWSEEDAEAIQAELDTFRAARAALGAVPVTDKRIEVQGEILSIRYQEGNFGPGSGSYKMLLQCEGYKLWGSVPSGLNAERGDKVAFMAAIEVGDDPAFGFFKRPTKARTL